MATTYVLLLHFLIALISPQGDKPTVKIREIKYRRVPHFRIETPRATYYLEKQSGGLSRVLDADENDWVAFDYEEVTAVPKSAAAGFRGIPNLVFRDPGNGIGHPGFDRCNSVVVNDSTIRVTSYDGLWQWSWQFTSASLAVLTLEKTDDSRAYWFLYEGPSGGIFEPSKSYFVTQGDGIHSETPELMAGQATVGQWQWACFGHYTLDRVLLIYQAVPDTLADFMSYMGADEQGINAANGMTVFGFGRSTDTKPLLTAKNRFVIGFYEDAVYRVAALRTFEAFIEKQVVPVVQR